MSTDRYLPLAGRLHRVEHTDRTPLARASLADLECVHGEVGACLDCDLATTDAGHSVIARGHWPADYHDVPATLADFECVHLVIGPCRTCDLELVVRQSGRHLRHADLVHAALAPLPVVGAQLVLEVS